MKKALNHIKILLIIFSISTSPSFLNAQAGSLDLSFDLDGIVTTDIGTPNDASYSIAIQSDGRLVVVGQSNNGSTSYDFTIVRYNSNGSLDTTFDTDGIVTTDIGNNLEVANSVAIQGDGKIVVVGYRFNTLIDDIAVVRYNINGSLDTSFDSDGIVITDIGISSDRANAVTLQPDGKILVADAYAHLVVER